MPRMLKPHAGNASPPRPLTTRGLLPAGVFSKVNVTIGISLIAAVFLWPLGLAFGMAMAAISPGMVVMFWSVQSLIPIIAGFYMMRWLVRAGMLPSAESYFLLPIGNSFILLAMLPIAFAMAAGGGQAYGGVGIVSGMLLVPALALCPLGLAQFFWVLLKRAR